jgi:mono/diheme cytochrome c family protein
MKRWNVVLLVLLTITIIAFVYGIRVIRHGFSAADKPTAVETVMARTVRNLGIPNTARKSKNPWTTTPEVLQEAQENFTQHCANCHGKDGNGQSEIGQNLYPKAPDLRLPATQNLKDGEIHYIIRNGVRLTGMPAWKDPHLSQDDNTAWKLVLFIRSISLLTSKEKAQQDTTAKSAHYVGSMACQK